MCFTPTGACPLPPIVPLLESCLHVIATSCLDVITGSCLDVITLYLDINVFVLDPDPCADPILNYCSNLAACSTTALARSFTCTCKDGYDDLSPNRLDTPGEVCQREYYHWLNHPIGKPRELVLHASYLPNYFP